ncbi:MAG: TrkA family potassium uptake protein [Clostridia bacterium]|nr:TrkA family potassium uptake protein [Clostridia bacterium]
MSINKTYAVFGLGRYGLAVAKELCSNGAHVIAVDVNEKIVEDHVGEFPVCKCADVTDPEVLERLDIASVDTVIIAMASGLEASVMATMLCKEAGVSEVIVKCASELHERIFLSVGADRVILPEIESGKRLAKDLLSSGFIDIAAISDDISIIEILVPKKWAGKSLRELDLRKNFGLNVIALIKNEKTELIANPDTVLDDDTKLIIIANKSDIERIK